MIVVWVATHIAFANLVVRQTQNQLHVLTKIQCITRVNKNSLSILRHESVPSRSVLGCQHNRTVLTQNGSGSIKINVCAKTEPPVEHAPHAPASLDFCCRVRGYSLVLFLVLFLPVARDNLLLSIN